VIMSKPSLLLGLGEWPSFPAASHDEAVAPAFAIFEGWAFLLPGSRDFADSHLRSPRLIDQNRSGFIIKPIADNLAVTNAHDVGVRGGHLSKTTKGGATVADNFTKIKAWSTPAAAAPARSKVREQIMAKAAAVSPKNSEGL
jgi:hypothetical protein